MIQRGPCLAGYSERFFTEDKTQQHIDNDLLPFQWCCVQSPLCNVYLAKRPLDRCQGYSWNSSDSTIPGNRGAPGIGMVYGSLHFITFDGSEYTFKAVGEYVILRLSSSTGSNIFTLQGQTVALVVNGWPNRYLLWSGAFRGRGLCSALYLRESLWSLCMVKA
ncbi:protein mesh-like [Danio aesculapii]|uniref:protein mesh-like n=1 Tax=Danio aesculapii TaxID=1142201 RepID=UPI0024C0C6C3|nr:protein mesh-like [Danio aesculapii]